MLINVETEIFVVSKYLVSNGMMVDNLAPLVINHTVIYAFQKKLAEIHLELSWQFVHK